MTDSGNTPSTPPGAAYGWFVRWAWVGPAFLAAVFIVALGVLLWLMEARELRREGAELASSTRSAFDSIRRPLDATRDFLAVQADEIARDALDGESFSLRFSQYIDDHPELVGVAYVGADSAVRWMAPAVLSARAKPVLEEVDLTAGAPRLAWHVASRTRQGAYSGAYLISRGETGVALCVPVFRRQEFLGAIIAVYGCERLLRSVLPREVLQHHQVSLLNSAGQRVYALPAMNELNPRLITLQPLELDGAGLTLRLERYGSPFWGPGLQLLVLMCVGLVLGMAWGMWQLNRQVARRSRAEMDLRKARDELELRVWQRTSDLAEANDQLQHEIVERERAEQQARQHQNQLAHVARARTMGEMAAGLAHELNQPLGAIAGYAEGCIRLIESNQTEPGQLSPALQEVSRQARRAGQIIHRLREFYRDGVSERQAVAPSRLVGELVDLLAADLRQQQVQLILNLPDNLPCVPLDRIQIQQVLLNLMRNGMEAMQDIPVELRQLTVEASAPNPRTLQFSVADCGPGCGEEDLHRIFEPFFTTKSQGMGMGLSISRTIVEAHGGRMWAQPNTPRGLIVSFTLTTPGESP